MTISQRTAIRRVIYACLGITSIFVSQAGAGVRESNALALILTAKYLQEQRVTVTEQEMRQEFLNEKHHVGGELVVLNTKVAADALYKDVKDPKRWEGMKARGTYQVRPVSLMTLTAIIDLWGVPKEQIYAFHAMSLGSIGPPMPFGKRWAVFRLLGKQTGDLQDFPHERDSYLRKVEMKKKYQALKQRVEQLEKAARLKMFVKPE
jgi:hypothetical protein